MIEPAPIFVGASSASYPVSSGVGTVPTFSEATGTQPNIVSGHPPPSSTEAPSGLVEWLESDAARPYEGQWVLLQAGSFDLIDSDTSPSELLHRHPDQRSPLIVYVQPRGVTLAV
jgi:hypothetical protein